MKQRFFYWLKIYLGFSGKEAKGFLLVIPILLLFSMLPTLLRLIKNKDAEVSFIRYQDRLDSLEILSAKLVSSPLPTFNPQDTVKLSRNQSQAAELNRLPLSQADSVILQIVPGIGPGTAGRIVKYREQLGGFHSKAQLLEVYGLKEETLAALWDFFEFDSVVSRKIRVNTAGLEEFAAHPYISYGAAKVLVAYRNQHGSFTSTDDLKKIKIFKEVWIQSLTPYLEFDGSP